MPAIFFSNAIRTVPLRPSENEAEIRQLLTDGWVPFHDQGQGVPYQVTRQADGTWLMDGMTISDALISSASSIPWWVWIAGAYLAKKIFFG